jgi:hypothetical protein
MENAMGYVLLIMAVAVIGEFVSIALQWRKLENRSKIVLGIVLPVQLFSTIALFLLSWGIFPWGRAGALATADRFLSTMKQGDYLEATQYMQPCVRDFVGLDVLGTPEETRPTRWQWTDYESNGSFASTIGTARFIDNVELRIEIKLSWNGYKWELYGVTFGEPYKNPRLQFSWGC